MFLVPLCHGPGALGIVISPLIGLMDEQVYTASLVHMTCNCMDVVLYLNAEKIAKLSSVGVKAVRVVPSDNDVYPHVLTGNYSLAKLYI